MKKILIEPLAAAIRLVAKPVALRAATALGAFLLGQGVPAEITEQTILALGVLGGLLLDIAVSIARQNT